MPVFDWIAGKLQAAREKRENRAVLQRLFMEAAADGKFTDEEVRALHSKMAEYGLTHDDIRKIRTAAYQHAFNVAKRDGMLTREEELELDNIQRRLGIDNADVAHTKLELQRLRLLNEIQQGNLPSVEIPNLVLQKGEDAHWAEPASLLEERVVRRSYQGGSHGFSIRIAKGVTYRVGAHRGHLVSETKVLPVSHGHLVITSKHVIFKGDRKSFKIPFRKLLEMEFFSDGIRLTPSTGKPHVLSFHDSGNVDIVGAVLSQAISASGA